MPADRPSKLWMVAIVLVACGLRLAGVFDQGYPYSFYPDESSNVQRSMSFYNPERGGLDLNPGWFNKPTLTYYLNFGAYGFYYLWGRYVTHQWPDPLAFGVRFTSDQGPFYVIGRLINVCFATLTVIVVYRLMKNLRGRRAGLVAAAFLAVCVGHVVWAQTVKEDAIATFFFALSLLGLAKVETKGRWRDSILAGAGCGLGFAAKFHPLVAVVPMIVAHARAGVRGGGRAPQRAAKLGASMASTLVFAFLGAPYVFLDPSGRSRFANILTFTSKMLGFGAGEVNPMTDAVFGQLLRGAVTFMGHGFGDAAFTVAFTELLVIGAVLWARGPMKRSLPLPLLAFAVAAVTVAIANEQWPRKNHMMMLYPPAACLAAGGAIALGRILRARLGRFGEGQWTAAILACAVLLPVPGFAAYELVREIRALRAVPSQLEAFDWIQANVPEGATILNDFELLPLRYDDRRLDWLLRRIGDYEANATKRAVAATDPLVKSGEEALVKRYRRYRIQHELLQRAQRHYGQRRYDVVILDHPWQTERADAEPSRTAAYNDLWAREPLAQPDEWKWTAQAYRATPETLPAALRGRTPIFEKCPADYLVSSDETYDNYMKEHKRVGWPNWSHFYADLKSHYDSWEINGDRRRPGPIIRVFDLRRRHDHPTVTRVGAAD
jgi:4-amino-4-deoxy-L-arabinose transferase-like glycosyltransferase